MRAEARARVRDVPGDGLRLRCYEWGAEDDPEPVVLLHGITGSALAWSAVAAAIAPRRRVLAFDARGHGHSEWSASEAYAPDHHFADLAVALETLAVQRCTIVGFSMGGAVAIVYASALPERTARLVVVDAYPDPELSPGSRRIAELIAAAYRNGFAALPSGFDPAIARRLDEDLASGNPRRLDLWPLWEALQVPALVVRGAGSDVLSASRAEEMLRRQPLARLVTLPGVAHEIPYRRPRELGRAILDFIADT